MSLSIEERAELRSTARSVLARASSPEQVRAVTAGDGPGYDPGLWRQVVDLGWTAIPVDERHGGAGCGWADLAIVLHELGRALACSPFLASAVLATSAIQQADDGDLARSLLPALAAGELVGTVALAATDGSCDAACSTTTWRADGDGLVLDGAAGYVPDADLADLIVVTAVDAAGATAVVALARDAPGVRVERTPTVDATRRLFTVSFGGVVAGRERLLREPGAASAELAERVRSVGVVAASCDAAGAAERALERTAEYARERQQFGTPIGAFQAVKHHCADMAIAVEASRAATGAAAEALDGDPADWARVAAITSSYVGPACSQACALGLLVHGGIGFTWEHDAHLYLKRVKLDEVLFGTPSWHRRRLADAVFPALGASGGERTSRIRQT